MTPKFDSRAAAARSRVARGRCSPMSCALAGSSRSVSANPSSPPRERCRSPQAWASSEPLSDWPYQRRQRPRQRCRGRASAPCRPFSRWVSLARPPNRTCDFHRIRLSTNPYDGRRVSSAGAACVGSPVPSPLLQRQRWCVGVHRRPPGIPHHSLQIRCPPSPCGRLSRPRTTTRAPPHPGLNSRRRTCPPPPTLGGGEGDPEMVPTFTMHRSTGEVSSFAPAASPWVRRRPSPWPPHRHSEPASESTTTRRWGSCTADRPASTRLEPACRLRSVTRWFKLCLHLPVSLAGPGPFGGADPSRRCRGCSHPSPASPGSGCPQLQRPAATGQRWSPFTSTRYMAPRGAPEQRDRTTSQAKSDRVPIGIDVLVQRSRDHAGGGSRAYSRFRRSAMSKAMSRKR